ncbi:MAG: hypothetical protein ACRDY5_07155 [Acidimicrobiales bacterium]
MVQIHDRDLLSVTAATRKGVSGLIAEAQSGRDIIRSSAVGPGR